MISKWCLLNLGNRTIRVFSKSLRLLGFSNNVYRAIEKQSNARPFILNPLHRCMISLAASCLSWCNTGLLSKICLIECAAAFFLPAKSCGGLNLTVLWYCAGRFHYHTTTSCLDQIPGRPSFSNFIFQWYETGKEFNQCCNTVILLLLLF